MSTLPVNGVVISNPTMQPDLPTPTSLCEIRQFLLCPPTSPTPPGCAGAGQEVGAAPCCSQLIPAHSAMDPPRAKAEPMDHMRGKSMKIHLGKGRKCQRGGNKEGRVHQRGQWGSKRTRREAPWPNRHTPAGTVARRRPMLEQRRRVRRKEQWKKRVINKERQR